MLTSPSRVLLGIKMSRFLRGSLKDIKKKFSKGNEGTPSSFVGETILPPAKANREKKYKSTLAVAVAGTAMGVSHVAAVSGKYRKTVSGPKTLGIGIGIGVLTAGIWYNYIDAAYDGVTEEDISMMFEMANSTGYGSLDDDGDSAKAVDILHAIVTGKVSEDSKSESLFSYEDEDEDDDESDEEGSSVFGKTVSFSDSEPKKVSGFGQGGIGKSLSKGNGLGRKSFLPVLDRQESEGRTEVGEGWMDFA